MSAGYCWPWSDPRPDGTLVNDVRIGGWSGPRAFLADLVRVRGGLETVYE
jgi:hypothetical protein